jgi:hypothetical protein
MKRRGIPFSAGLVMATLLLAGGLMFGCVRVADALGYRAPDPADFGGSSSIMYTLSATTDVHSSSSMEVTVYRPGNTNPGSVKINVTYQGGAWTGNQNSQGEGHVHFNGSSTYDPSSITLTNWQPDPAGHGYRATISASLKDPGQSGDDSNHINFYLTSTNKSDIIGPDNTQQFAIVNATTCAAAPNAINCPTHTYVLPFAPDCGITKPGTASVKVYDMDQGNPGIQPQHLKVQIVDTTTGATVNNDSFTPSNGEGNSQSAFFNFTYTPAHKYKAYFYSANIQNILQLTLPFDSVNAIIDCTQGQVTSTATQGCTSLQGWMYDQNSPGTQLKYYVDVNPAGTPPATYTTTPSGGTFAGPFTANLSTPAAPVGGSHGFKVNIPADVNGHNYKTSWSPNHYWIYAKDASNNIYTRVDDLSVPTCTSAQCPAPGALDTFVPGGIGVPFNFHVGVQTAGTVTTPGVNPPGNPTFAIKVTGPGLGSGSTYTATAQPIGAGTRIYSNDVSFTPPQGGTYQVTWSYSGANNCTDSGDAGYAPYFSALGGDIAAGVGFGGGCSENSADVIGLNTGSAANYAGAGSEIGALASGQLQNFVSGMGLGGGAAQQTGSGVSFANDSGTGGGLYGGNFNSGSAASIPCVSNYFAGANGNAWTGWGGIGGAGVHNFTVTTPTLTLSGGSLAPDTTVNLYVKGDVYITQDITYGAYTLGHVPRFNLYVAGNIYIDKGVQELHGVYVAQKNGATGGDIDTCVTMPGGTLTLSHPYGECKTALNVYGSMMSEGKLILERTEGNLVAVPSAPAVPAESFRYGPELWLSNQGATLQTQAYASLPPVL